MQARLIAYTQAAEGVDCGEDVREMVAYFARVSSPDNQGSHGTGGRLIRYLIRNRHWSPFEMVSATIEVETTRDIARQLLRHRSFTFQELSQRYQRGDILGFDWRPARMQDERNRQASLPCPDPALNDHWMQKQTKVIEAAQEAYDWAIEQGIAKEVARVVLPEGLTMSRLYVQGTLRSFIHYIQLRCEEGTQAEHRELAREIARAVSLIFPMMDDMA